MPKTPTLPMSGEPQADEAVQDRRFRDGAVGGGVLAALGRPVGLYQVTVRPLWGNYYRVNVLIGPDATSVRVVHSYFIDAGDGGEIRSATPPITRLYP
jgi:hypothetical protein